MPLSRRQTLACGATLGFPAAAAPQPAATPAPLQLAAEVFPPFSQWVQGRAEGLDCELVRAVLAGLGRGAEIQLLPWKRALLELERGTLDGVIGISRGNLNEREEMLAFPEEPLAGSHSHLYFRVEQPFAFDGLFTLKGRSVAVLAGYQYPPDFMAAAYFRREPSATHEQSLRKLLARRVDLALVHAGVGEHLLQREGWQRELAADPTPLAPGRLYVGFARQRGHALLAQRFGEALRRYKAQPAYRALLARYGVRPENLLAAPL